jgi:hypothetical protein
MGGEMTKDEVKHSPLPWNSVLADSIAGDDRDAIWIECEDHSIAELICPKDEGEANAALIVRAVNCYADLLIALGRIAAMEHLPIGSQSEEMSTRLETASIAQGALRRARGESK